MVNSIKTTDIMIVDDNIENLKFLRDILCNAGHNIRTANSGELALASISAKIPTLVLLDIRMPGIDGYEVCRRIKADPATKDLMVIFLSAIDDKEDKVKGFKLGASDYITKPFETEEVLARVDNFLQIYLLQQELKNKTKRMENIIDGTDAGTWEWNVQTGEQTINERWAEMLGYTIEELEPISIETWEKFTYPEDIEKSGVEIARVFNKEKDYYNLEVRMYHKDGSCIWVNSRGIVNSWTPDGKPLIASGIHLDITFKKMMDNRLKESEERFQMLFNQAPLGYQSLDFEGCFIEVNPKWLDMLGYTHEEVIGKWFGDFLSPAYQDGFRKRFPIFKAQGYIHSEFEMVCKTGQKLFIAFDGKIGYDQAGDFKQTHCILKDITMEKTLKQDLADSRELMQAIIDNTTDAIYVKDIDGKYLLLNTSVELITGKFAEDVVGKDDYYLFSPSEAASMMAGDREIMKLAAAKTFEEVVTDASGKLSTFLSTKGPIFDGDSKVKGLFGIARNITDRKELELNLSNEKKLLEATLISVGDGVISCDKNGAVLFLNPIAENLTGWSQIEAKGKPIEEVFHIINETTEVRSENIAEKVLQSGVIQELANHTLLISKDGVRRPIEDSAAPIIQEDGQIIGVVIVFSDFSEKREKIDQIQYLSYHDYLTGLYNRRFFEEELKRYDTARNIPITIAMGDVNGLKLINDSFGHDVGDELLKKTAQAIANGCRADDIVARLGGDEFVIILPKTDALEADRLLKRIQTSLSEQKIGAIALSVSFGFETKLSQTESLQDILKNAENHMYRHKLYESASMRSKTINLIMNTLYEKNNREMLHSKRVSDLCESIAKHMNYSNDDINQIGIAGLMHDIGKIGIEDNILNKNNKLDPHEWEEIKKHSEIGYRILSSVNEFSEIADFVLEHQEKWDGTGYPRGLKGEQISLQARIIAIADSFDAMTGERTYGKTHSIKEALEEIRNCSGTQFDPTIAKIFIEEVMKED